MRNIFTAVATVAVISVSSTAVFADNITDDVNNLKGGIESLEKNMTAQGIEFNKNSEVLTTNSANYVKQEKALQARYDELQSIYNESRAN